MARLYIAYNGASPTTAAQAKVAVNGAGIKTMLQVATPATTDITVLEWSISFDGTTAATPFICELIQTDVVNTGTLQRYPGACMRSGTCLRASRETALGVVSFLLTNRALTIPV